MDPPFGREPSCWQLTRNRQRAQAAIDVAPAEMSRSRSAKVATRHRSPPQLARRSKDERLPAERGAAAQAATRITPPRACFTDILVEIMPTES